MADIGEQAVLQELQWRLSLHVEQIARAARRGQWLVLPGRRRDGEPELLRLQGRPGTWRRRCHSRCRVQLALSVARPRAPAVVASRFGRLAGVRHLYCPDRKRLYSVTIVLFAGQPPGLYRWIADLVELPDH